jgi:AcrR family transcriptional regulator
MEIDRSKELPAEDTRQRILEAAGEVFAQHGFHRATIREICAKAGANVAAVNYHFGDKERLYVAVVRYAHLCALVKHPATAGLSNEAPPEERIHGFVRSFLNRLMDEGRPAWHWKLFGRELSEPTAALDLIVQEQVRPNFLFISQAVKDFLGAETPPEIVRTCVASIVGQCLFYHFGRPIFERLNPDLKLGPAAVDPIARHVTDFSLAGLRSVRERRGTKD